MESELIGYVRKSNSGKAIKINLIASKVNKARKVDSKAGKVIPLVINLKSLMKILNDEKEVTNISQLLPE